MRMFETGSRVEIARRRSNIPISIEYDFTNLAKKLIWRKERANRVSMALKRFGLRRINSTRSFASNILKVGLCAAFVVVKYFS